MRSAIVIAALLLAGCDPAMVREPVGAAPFQPMQWHPTVPQSAPAYQPGSRTYHYRGQVVTCRDAGSTTQCY